MNFNKTMTLPQLGLPKHYNISLVLRSNLGVALFLLPRAQRKDAFLFYSFCHAVDTIADDPLMAFSEKEELLAEWLGIITNLGSSASATINIGSESLASKIQEMILRRKLNRHHFCEIIQGVRMDLSLHRYTTFENLHPYLWRVASVVGLISAELFGAKGKIVHTYAEELGIALQLTNILRDVAEDAAMGRIYLPLEDLARFQITEEEILKATPSPQATHLFNYQTERALSYFAKAELAWEKMTSYERRLMRPARLMEAIYRELLQVMQRNRYDLFHQRYKISLTKKISLAIQVIFSC